MRIFVSGKPDIANLAGFLCFQHGFLRAILGKDAVRIVKANNLVVLDQVKMVGLQALQRFIDLFGRFFFGAAIELRHQENFLPVAILQRFAHADFALAFVVVP